MNLSEGIQKAYTKKWSMINTFSVIFTKPTILSDPQNLLGEDINLNILSVQTPDFTNDPIEAYIANKWIIQNGKDSLYRFSITFRDFNQLSLYKMFMQIYALTKNNYFDDVKMTIDIIKDADWVGEDNELIFLTLGGTLIEGISNISFNNETENQIAEFTVSFKCTTPSGTDIPKITDSGSGGPPPGAESSSGTLLDSFIGAVKSLF